MDVDAMRHELFYLISYMITSARGLYDEPEDYGVFRLLDAAGRVLDLMESQDLLDPFLVDLKGSIDEEREGEMDPDRQRERVDAMVLRIAEELQRRV
jgi:hypothetical protein